MMISARREQGLRRMPVGKAGDAFEDVAGRALGSCVDQPIALAGGRSADSAGKGRIGLDLCGAGASPATSMARLVDGRAPRSLLRRLAAQHLRPGGR